MARACVPLAALGLSACMPPSVKTVDDWLFAYERGDHAAMERLTVAADRPLVKDALQALTSSPTSDLALALPPRPQEHEVLEIESKSADGKRQVILVKTTLKNPLPAMSRRVGQKLEGVPETRGQWRRFLVVEEGGAWGVKLDLAAVLARSAFTLRFLRLLDAGRVDAAEQTLAEVPAPPDDPNAQKGADRLPEELKAVIAKRRQQLAAPPPPPPL